MVYGFRISRLRSEPAVYEFDPLKLRVLEWKKNRAKQTVVTQCKDIEELRGLWRFRHAIDAKPAHVSTCDKCGRKFFVGLHSDTLPLCFDCK